MKYIRYNKNLDYSYAMGIYPTIELLKYRSEYTVKLITHSKLKAEAGWRIVTDLCKKHNIYIENNDKFIEKISAKSNCYLAGIFTKYQTVLKKNNNQVVLVNPKDTGNLGTIIRSMVAFGYNELAIIKPATDFFQPEVIRASMGAVFNINFQLFDSIDEYLTLFPNHNFYSLMSDGENSLVKIKIKKPYALIFGSESAGLPEIYRCIGQPIRIEQSEKVDSLNLAVAVGIVLHYLGTKKQIGDLTQYAN